jgi:opacity protein-like surface antigen
MREDCRAPHALRAVGLRWLAGAVAGLGLAAGGAAADPATPGWYAAIDLGAHLHQDAPTTSQLDEPDGRPAQLRFHTDERFAGFVRVGYRAAPHLRFELEGGWRPGDLRSIVEYRTYLRAPGSILAVCGAGPGACPSPSGGLTAASLMGNVYLDLWPIGRRLLPYVGVGAGVADVRLQTAGSFQGPAAPGRLGIDDADVRPAYQALAGAAIRLDAHWTADLGYRLFYSGGQRWRTTATGAIPLGDIRGMYMDHAFTLGARYAF